MKSADNLFDKYRLVLFARRRSETLSKSFRKSIGAAMANLIGSPH